MVGDEPQTHSRLVSELRGRLVKLELVIMLWHFLIVVSGVRMALACVILWPGGPWWPVAHLCPGKSNLTVTPTAAIQRVDDAVGNTKILVS